MSFKEFGGKLWVKLAGPLKAKPFEIVVFFCIILFIVTVLSLATIACTACCARTRKPARRIQVMPADKNV